MNGHGRRRTEKAFRLAENINALMSKQQKFEKQLVNDREIQTRIRRYNQQLKQLKHELKAEIVRRGLRVNRML